VATSVGRASIDSYTSTVRRSGSTSHVCTTP
jgi:hypothetical protein